MQRQKVDLNLLDEYVSSPLELAILTSSLSRVVLLVRHGARLDKRNADGKKPIHVALESHIGNKIRICTFLVSKDIQPNASVLQPDGR